MKNGAERIPLQVDVRRIIEVLATQIYQSSLALLRENTQNAFDALLMRHYKGDVFEPRIEVEIKPTQIRISDNGLGMTYAQVRENFWQAGSSSKNTPEARNAGVVGTFGIGAMANFGIATHLIVITESALNGERTETRANRATLSTKEDCIEMIAMPSRGHPGTVVTAIVPDTAPIDVASATAYITDFVRHVAIPVTVNGTLISQQPLDSPWPKPSPTWSVTDNLLFSSDLSATAHARAGAAGQIWIDITDFIGDTAELGGRIVLTQGAGQIRTFRSGFGLATVAVASVYGFGGAIDLPMLQPTAGREALSTHSMTFLQGIVQNIENWVSERFGNDPVSNNNIQFIEWARRNGRPDLCGQLRLIQAPSNEQITLAEVQDRTSSHPMLFYAGSDEQVVRALASEETPLLRGSQRNPRRACEQAYLSRYCQIEPISEGPSVIKVYPQGTREIVELAIAHRVSDTLERDYFLPAEVKLAQISHNVPVLVMETGPIARIALDPSGSSFSVLKELYTTEYSAFGSFVKDYVRTAVFPQVENLVPSSTQEGAAAFLKRIRSRRHLFEYELADRQELGSIWEDYHRGNISFEEAADRSRRATRGSIQVVAHSAQVSDIAPDLVSNQEHLPDSKVGQPLPAIRRPDVATKASILTIDDNNPPLNGFRCFLAISDRVMAEKGDFFLQPHRTSVVWGGLKVLFVFQHHSGEFGLYYDIHLDELVSQSSGGGECLTSTLLLGSRVFVPVPNPIQANFIPSANRSKRLEVRGEVLHIRAAVPVPIGTA